jgi:phospholipid/cholesterol/gamma-HCH transport system ATP-binding protein
MADQEAVIKVQGVSTCLNGQWVHRGLDLTVYRNEVLGLIGGSGSGKSVLLHEIIGLRAPNDGSIEVLGHHPNELRGTEVRELRRRWGVLFQEGALFSAYTVYENIAFPFRELKKEGIEVEEQMIRDAVMLKMHMVGLSAEDAWKYPGELSGGMLKRAALARALALDAELLFLDEPTTGLDPLSASELDSLFLDLRAELNPTALMISHDLNTLAALSDRVAVLDEGRVLTTGPIEEVAKFDHPFVKRYFQQRQGEQIVRSLPTV